MLTVHKNKTDRKQLLNWEVSIMKKYSRAQSPLSGKSTMLLLLL